MTKALELQSVSKQYGQTRALDQVDLDIGEGEAVAVLGPNGAGKSTMLSIALGLRAADTGTTKVFGSSPVEALKAGRVGVLLQEAGLPEDVRVSELVETVAGMYAKPLPAVQTMRAAGVEQLAGKRIGQLSGGQRQRVRFALALAGDPKLLVLDEPTVGLDVDSRRSLWHHVRERVDAGCTVVFATHYLTEADDYADRVVLLSEGKIVADGPVEQIKALVGGLEVRFTMKDADPSRLESLPGVRQVHIDGPAVTLRTSDSDATLRALFLDLHEIKDVRTAVPDLESAFVSLTGGKD
ncbi:ATP-binding cassette domain-containing protein [Nonomuraea sp. NPDC050663]|uniref:ABC transporter ATP-binding protein n=1 Tax=Nonomuraea sp. NPDC050663 TaxID=3364370 RepID=UPI003799026F